MCDSCTPGNDETCGACTGRPFCVDAECRACLQDTDCPPRFGCDDNFTCVSSPCAGVDCQMGTSCDPASGLCVKPDGSIGCSSPADCALPDMGCNQQTGQCFYGDGTCDPGGGGQGVCMPGAICQNDPIRSFITTQMPVFTCGCNIDLPASSVCHPGQICAQALDIFGSGDAQTGCIAP